MRAEAVDRAASRNLSGEEHVSLRHFLLPTGQAEHRNADGHLELWCISYDGWLSNEEDNPGNPMLRRL